MSVPIGWNTGNDKRDTTAIAARHAIEAFHMVTGVQLSMEWGSLALRFMASEDPLSFDYGTLEFWLSKADACPFMSEHGYVSTMILQELLAWWEGICNHEHDSDAAIDDLTNPDYEEAELTPGQEEFLENAYQDKVEQGEP